MQHDGDFRRQRSQLSVGLVMSVGLAGAIQGQGLTWQAQGLFLDLQPLDIGFEIQMIGLFGGSHLLAPMCSQNWFWICEHAESPPVAETILAETLAHLEQLVAGHLVSISLLPDSQAQALHAFL